MARFNQLAIQTTRTRNYAGGMAYKQPPKLELVSVLLTSFADDKFYRSFVGELEVLSGLLDKVDPKFAAKSAIYARQIGMRSITHVLLGELAYRGRGQGWQWFKRAIYKAAHRPDDLTETVAYYLDTYGKPLPAQLKKGVASALTKFDEYQLGKYRAARAEVKLVDLLNLTHPRPSANQEEAFKKLVNGTLRGSGTWEVGLTRAGQEARTEEERELLKARAWEELIRERKIGYFALLRNLRNIVEQVPQVLDEALQLLTDERLIRNSKVLPFRYQTALKVIEGILAPPKVFEALERAVEIALGNVPKLEGTTLVALDGSGSMSGRPLEIASLFAAALYKSNNADLLIFSDDAEYYNPSPLDSILTLADRIERACPRGGTNFHAIFDTAARAYDRIIILSDAQGWIGIGTPTKAFADYKARVKANPHVFSIDLAGYGTLQLPEQQVYCLAGFSEKIFDIMRLFEKDRSALITEIEKIEL